MDPTQGMQAAPAPQAAPDAPQAPSGYCVELHVTGDGKMSVSVEPEQAESEEGGDPNAAPDAESKQPVANIGEAMKLIREIVAHAGEMADTGASQDEMASGYDQGGM